MPRKEAAPVEPELEETPSEEPISQQGILDMSAEEIESYTTFACVSPGEYDVLIKEIVAGFTKKQNPRLNVVLEVVNEKDSSGHMTPIVMDEGVRLGYIREKLNLPYQGCKPTARTFFNDMLAHLRLTFGISNTELTEKIQLTFLAMREAQQPEMSIDDFNGKIGRMIIGYEPPDGENRERNFVQSWIDA